MGSKIKQATSRTSDLKSSLSSIARRQNVLAAVPPAVRALPLLAFAAGDFYQRRYGETQPAAWLLGPADGAGTGGVGMTGSLGAGMGVGALESSVSTAVLLARREGVSTVSGSCGVCLRRGLAGFALANAHGPVDHAGVGGSGWNGACRVLHRGLRRRVVAGSWAGATRVPI